MSSGIRFVTYVLHVLRELVFSLLVLTSIRRFETVSIRSFYVGLIYDVSRAFPPKEINPFLTRS
jgi:hypothetical protein